MPRVIRIIPFTTFGLLTIVLFLIAEALNAAGAEGLPIEVLSAVLRAIIIPLWLMRYFVVDIGGALFGFGGDGFPGWFDIITIPILILPHLAADLLLGASRASRRRKVVNPIGALDRPERGTP